MPWGGLAGFRENLGTLEDRSRKAAIELTHFCAKQHFIILPQLGNFSHHVTHVPLTSESFAATCRAHPWWQHLCMSGLIPSRSGGSGG